MIGTLLAVATGMQMVGGMVRKKEGEPSTWTMSPSIGQLQGTQPIISGMFETRLRGKGVLPTTINWPEGATTQEKLTWLEKKGWLAYSSYYIPNVAGGAVLTASNVASNIAQAEQIVQQETNSLPMSLAPEPSTGPYVPPGMIELPVAKETLPVGLIMAAGLLLLLIVRR